MARLPVAAALVAAVSTLSMCSPASAESVFDPPFTLGSGGRAAQVVMGPEGDAAVAWAGRAGGVFVVRREPGAAFGPPERVTPEEAGGLSLQRNARGELAVAWIGPSAAIRVAIAGVGVPFGAPGSPAPPAPGPGAADGAPAAPPIPMPARPGVALALDAAGTAHVAFADRGRALLASRPLGGAFGESRELATGVVGVPQLAGDPSGGVTAVWAGPTPGAREGMDSVFVADRRLDGTITPPRAISHPALDASFNFNDPTVGVGPRGEAIVVWAGTESAFPMPSRADYAERDAAGRWTPARRIGEGLSFASHSKIAFNAGGDAVMTGSTYGATSDLAFRPVGGGFGPVRKTNMSVSGMEPRTPVALDALGVSVQIAGGSVDGFGRPNPLVGLVRERGAPLAQRFQISPTGESAEGSQVATDATGRGLVTWTTADGRVRAATYAAAAPSVAGLRLTRNAFEFVASRPAVLGISVSVRRAGRLRTVTQAAVAGRAANRVRFSARMRRFVAKKGRYSVVVTTRDRAPRTGRMALKVTVKPKAAKKAKPPRTGKPVRRSR